ncbi:divalent-cation tolerance protein CutA [Leptospira sp. 96542]|nr:divalent-cation tolerance protein CutA [Leptospira sp. 96542]
MEFYSVYVTFSNEEEAVKISNQLVSEGLAACANIMPKISSVYLWEGKLQNVSETLAFYKTNVNKIEKLQSRTKELHSYETPCILILPIFGGEPGYLDWVRNSL